LTVASSTRSAFANSLAMMRRYLSRAAGRSDVFDELWAFSSERSRRLWDEMIPPPTRQVACRLTVTYAGFEGESLLLEELYKRGRQQLQIGEDLYAGDGSHVPIAPWQTEAALLVSAHALFAGLLNCMQEYPATVNAWRLDDIRHTVDPA
jgi:hypothetical protein